MISSETISFSSITDFHGDSSASCETGLNVLRFRRYSMKQQSTCYRLFFSNGKNIYRYKRSKQTEKKNRIGNERKTKNEKKRVNGQ